MLIQVILLDSESDMELLETIKDLADQVNFKFSSTKWKPVFVVQGLPSQSELAPFYEDMRFMSTLGIGK